VQNSASSILLNQALTPAAVGTNSQLGVPIYNILGVPGFNNSATVSAIKASDGQTGFSDLLTVQGIFHGDVFELPAGPFQLAAGAQFVHEKLETGAGALLASGNLIGLNALPPFPGGIRERQAGFLEGHIPVLGESQNIPGFHSFEITASGRYEAINSHATSGATVENTADTLVPKVGFRWQPIDEQLTIRGTYSQGFVVPQLNQLFGPPLNSNPYIVAPDDTVPPTDPNYLKPVALQQNVYYISNPDVPPSTAETKTIGAVYSPKQVKGLTISVDYYHIEQPEYNFIPSGSRMVADLNANGTNSFYYNNPALHGTPVYQDRNNNPYVPTAGVTNTFITADKFGTLNIPLLPGGSIRTEGLDFGLNYRYETKDFGTFDLFANANVLFSYEVKLGAGTPWLSYRGQYTDSQAVAAPQGMIPDYNVNAGITWSICNFDYTVIAHYVPGVDDLGDTHPSVGAPVNDFLTAKYRAQHGNVWHVPDYYKIDMQLAYNIGSKEGKKWYDRTRIAVGVNNVTDEVPLLIASSSEDNTDKATYDIIGRFVYFEVTKKF
jgi:iron complex outermembrane receptor protein